MKVEEYWHGTIKNYRYDGDVSALSTDVHVAVFLLSPHRHLCAVLPTRQSGNKPSTPISQETFTCVGSYIGGLIAQHHPLQLPCAGVLGACFHS